MRQTYENFSQADLIRANRANIYELFRYLESSPYMDFFKSDGLSRWSCPFQYAWFNSVLSDRDATPADSVFIDESVAYFRSKHTSEICWWLEDGVNLESWQTLLAPRGFRLMKGPPGMSLDLRKLKESSNLPAQVEIKMADDAQGVRDCVKALIPGFGFPPAWEGSLLDFLFGLGLEGPYRIYNAYWDGKPISTAAVFLGTEVAGIYTVATIPEARGKGIGAAVSAAPLLDARKMGYQVGTLQSSEMGYPVYKKMGFEKNFNLSSFFLTF